MSWQGRGEPCPFFVVGGRNAYSYDYGGHPAQTLQDWRAPGPYGASPTQPYKCGQNVKIKVNTDVVLTLNILTAFIRLGRAGPVRGRVPSIIVGIVPSILFLFDFNLTLAFYYFQEERLYQFWPGWYKRVSNLASEGFRKNDDCRTQGLSRHQRS